MRLPHAAGVAVSTARPRLTCAPVVADSLLFQAYLRGGLRWPQVRGGINVALLGALLGPSGSASPFTAESLAMFAQSSLDETQVLVAYNTMVDAHRKAGVNVLGLSEPATGPPPVSPSVAAAMQHEWHVARNAALFSLALATSSSSSSSSTSTGTNGRPPPSWACWRRSGGGEPSPEGDSLLREMFSPTNGAAHGDDIPSLRASVDAAASCLTRHRDLARLFRWSLFAPSMRQREAAATWLTTPYSNANPSPLAERATTEAAWLTEAAARYNIEVPPNAISSPVAAARVRDECLGCVCRALAADVTAAQVGGAGPVMRSDFVIWGFRKTNASQ